MKLYSKRKFALKDGEGVEHVLTPLGFDTVPDSCRNDNTFKFAVACGDISVIESAKQAVVVEEKTMKEPTAKITEKNNRK